MFGKKKEKVEITPGEPQFLVKYIGNEETFVANGKGCTTKLVQKIWDNSEEERKLRKYAMLIVPTGMILQDLENKNRILKFDIKSISYYCVEQGAHDRIFAWIYHNTEIKKFHCHAVLCTSREKAQTAAIILRKSLQIAYKDWKAEKNRSARMKSNAHLQHAALETKRSIEEADAEVNFNKIASRSSSIKSSESGSTSSERGEYSYSVQNGDGGECSHSVHNGITLDPMDLQNNAIGYLNIEDEEVLSSIENSSVVSSEHDTETIEKDTLV